LVTLVTLEEHFDTKLLEHSNEMFEREMDSSDLIRLSAHRNAHVAVSIDCDTELLCPSRHILERTIAGKEITKAFDAITTARMYLQLARQKTITFCLPNLTTFTSPGIPKPDKVRVGVLGLSSCIIAFFVSVFILAMCSSSAPLVSVGARPPSMCEMCLFIISNTVRGV